jgi:hypothetical protein
VKSVRAKVSITMATGCDSFRFRCQKVRNGAYSFLGNAASPMPEALDGEVLALDADGRPSFNALQNYGSSGASLHFFIFDVLVLNGKDVVSRSRRTSHELDLSLVGINCPDHPVAITVSSHLSKAAVRPS